MADSKLINFEKLIKLTSCDDYFLDIFYRTAVTTCLSEVSNS